MHQAEFAFAVAQGAMTQPAQQFLAVGCIENVVERIALAAPVEAGRCHQQVEVVVAQYGDRGGAQVAHETQGLQ